MPGKTSPRKGRPLLLLPQGPWIWGSHWQIVPTQREALGRRNAEPLRIPAFLPEKGPLFEKLRTSSSWILPYGAAGQGLLGTCVRLRRHSGRGLPPLALSANGEGAKGCLFLTAVSSSLTLQDALVASCDSERRLLQAAFPSSERIFRIPLPVSRSMKPLSGAERRRFRHELGLKNADRMVVYAGRLSVQKNIHLLLQSFAAIQKEHSGAKLFVLGMTDDLGFPHLGLKPGRHYGLELALLAERLGINDSVFFQGSVSQEKLRLYLGACDLHASLTTHFGEDYGYSIAQGLACGAPTVITRWGGGIDFIDGGAAAEIPVRLENGWPRVNMRRAISSMLEGLEPGAARSWRERALAYAAGELSAAAVSTRWGEVIEELEGSTLLPGKNEALLPAPAALRFFNRQKRETECAINPEQLSLFKSVRDSTYLKIVRAYLGHDIS